MLSLISAADVQQALRDRIQSQRQSLKLSRAALAERSTVPAPTIKRFETTGEISLRQFILLWQSVDDLTRLHRLSKPENSASDAMPTSIEEVLNGY